MKILYDKKKFKILNNVYKGFGVFKLINVCFLDKVKIEFLLRYLGFFFMSIYGLNFCWWSFFLELLFKLKFKIVFGYLFILVFLLILKDK